MADVAGALKMPRPGWRGSWIGWRNKLIANPNFQRWATALPFGRRIARSEASRLFDLVAGFVYSQILAACVRLDVFSVLSEGPQSVAELSARLSLPLEGADRLLKAAAALDLAESLPDGSYALGRLGAAFLGNPGIGAMVAHHRLLYADLADPVALLRGTAAANLPGFWDYAGDAGGRGAGPYSQLMSASQPLVAGEILCAYDFGRHRRLLDIGGGEGAFLAAAGARHRELGLMLFDRPAVVARAARLNAGGDLAARAAVFGGDFRHDALPHGADVATLVRVLHDHDDPVALAILRAARAALPSGGTLLVAEPMADAPGARRMGDAYFGFYLAAMGRGRPRKPSEIKAMMMQTGFASTRTIPTAMPLMVQIVEAGV